LGKHDDIERNRHQIIEIIKREGGLAELQVVLEKFRAETHMTSNKTFYARLRELKEANQIMTSVLEGRTIIALAHDDPKTMLSQYAFYLHAFLQRIKADYDAIKPDQRGTVLSSLLLCILSHRLNVSVRMDAVDQEHADYLKEVLKEFDAIITEAHKFTIEKCKDDLKLLERVTMNFVKVANTFVKDFEPYIQKTEKEVS
jgi:hypothetical protein